MTREAISTPNAPAAIGPYSQAIAMDCLLFCSGQLGLDPASGALVDGVEAQAERAMAFWPNKGEPDHRTPLGQPYERTNYVAPLRPVVPAAAPGALRLPVVSR